MLVSLKSGTYVGDRGNPINLKMEIYDHDFGPSALEQCLCLTILQEEIKATEQGNFLP